MEAPTASNSSNLPITAKGAANAAFLLVLLFVVLPFFFSGLAPDSNQLQTSTATSNEPVEQTRNASVNLFTEPVVSTQSSSSQPSTVQTQISLQILPNPVALEDTMSFIVVVSPSPPTIKDRYSNITIFIYRPDGTVDLLGPFETFADNSKTVTYKPEMLGSYTTHAAYAGQSFTSRNVTYLGNESPVVTFNVFFEVPTTPKLPGTWIVDDDGPADFHTIHEAINAASNGDKILVKPGTYKENIVVNKSLTITGENANQATITPQTAGVVVTITAPNVTFERFKIKGSGNLHQNDYIGIYLTNPNASSTKIRDNIITENGYGISLSGIQNTVQDNSFTNNHLGGILVNKSSNNLIIRNNVTGSSGTMFGIFIAEFSYNNTLRNNNMTGSDLNLHIFSYDLQGMIHNIDTSNTVNGKPVYYWIDKTKQTVPHDAGAVYLINCSAITAQGLEIGYNGVGIELAYSTNCLVQENHITRCSNAIRLETSTNNTIRKNNIYQPEDCGIAVVRSSNNAINDNTIQSSSEADGLFVFCSSNNHFYHNSLSTRHQVWTENYVDKYTSKNNTWDNGYPSGGNYWIDYNGTDTNHDGIGDTPYIIDPDDQDRYPLMCPPSSDTTNPNVQKTWTVDDDSQADFHTIQEAIDAASTGDTIYVHSGTYIENLVVHKPLSLTGENAAYTTILAKNTGKTIYVTASRVTISGFTIQGQGTSLPFNIGICFTTSTSYGNITGNILIGHSYAVSLAGTTHNVDSNYITRNGASGIYLNGTSNNLITRNTVTDNTMTGIFIAYPSSHNTFRNNNMTGSKMNLHIIGYDVLSFVNDLDTSNTANGKPIYYLINKTNLTVPSDAGMVVLVNCTNITVQDLQISSNGEGILLAHTNNSTIQRNNITNCGNGIRVQYSSNNQLNGNHINNCDGGIALMNATSNTASGNTITASSMSGIWVFLSSNNKFHHNKLTNKIQVQIDDLQIWNNTWDNGKEGNYWSDYSGTDTNGDGVGDKAYVIDDNNLDHYPLATPPNPQ
jgi:parallel beta-helix repeat protein